MNTIDVIIIQCTSTAFTILAGTLDLQWKYFDISNISIIEITTDTNLPRINYEGFSYQDALGSEDWLLMVDFAYR